MRKFELFLGIVAANFVSGPAGAQVFGIAPGDPVSRYRGEIAGDGSDPAYYKITAPERAPAFEEYYAFATPETGICKVVAIGKPHQNDTSGVATVAAFRAQRLSLARTYGEGELDDSIEDYSGFKARNQWARAVHEGDRRLSIFWGENQKTQLPASIQTIVLSVDAKDATSPRIEVAYQFANWKQCWAARAEKIRNRRK